MSDEPKLYDIGYGKPPAATRWQKGQSGNPKGPRKTAGLRTMFLDAAAQKHADPLLSHLNDSTQIKALMTECFRRALRGDARYAKFLLQFADRYLPDDEEEVGE